MSEVRSIWGLRLLALLLAVLAWFFLSLEKREVRSQTVVEASVTYNHDPEAVILDPTEKLRVVVRGPASRVGSLNPFQVNIRIDLRDAERGEVEVPVGPENVVLPQGLEVVSIEPNVILLTLDREVTELKPISARLTGEPAAGAIYLEPDVSPPVALVRGPESRIRALEFMTTTPVTLDGHAIDFEDQAAVVSPDPLVRVVQPALVTVRVPMEIPGTGNQNEDEQE